MGAGQFTPGPWRYGPAVRTGKMCVMGANDTFVCGQLVNFSEFENEGEANARLIAAAPELYEALDRVLRTARGIAKDDLAAAFAALAKARGQ